MIVFVVEDTLVAWFNHFLIFLSATVSADNDESLTLNA